MIWFIKLILRHRLITAALLMVSLGLSAFSARTLQIRFQFRDFFDYAANRDLPLFKQDNEEFGDPGGYVVALVEADDVFRRDVLEYIDRLAKQIEPNPVFSRVRTLTNVHAIRGKGEEVITGPLMPEIPITPEAMVELKNFALASPLLARRLVSHDGRTTAVLAEMRTPATFATIAEQKEALSFVKEVYAKNPAPPGMQVRITGAPAVEVGTTDSLINDQLILMPAVMTVLIIALYLTFRSFHGIVLAMSAVTVATAWTAGIFALFGRPVDITGSIIPTTILVYGVVDPIFVLSRVLMKVDNGVPQEQAIVQSLKELALPCFLASVTTALGFAAFVTAPAPTIKFYGLTVAIGVLLAWVTTNTVLPLLLSVIPLPKRRFGHAKTTVLLDNAIRGAWSFMRPRIALVSAAGFVLLALGGAFAYKQHISTEYVGGLPRGQEQADVRHLEQRLAGVIRFIIHLDGAPDSMKNPKVLKAIAALDAEAEKNPLITVSTSLSDLVAEANQAFNEGAVAERRVPDSQQLVSQYLALVDPRDRADFATEDYARSHIAMLVTDKGSESARELAKELQQKIDAAHLESFGIRATLTGNGVVAYNELDKVVIDLLRGFVIAFVIVIFVEWIMFRSIRAALISVVPNLLPVVACFVAMRVLGLKLRIDNTLVLCISIGGLFNTTIHLIARVLQQIREGATDRDLIIENAMRQIGPPSLFTATILSAGFAVLMLSSFPGLQALGFLSMVTLIVGFFCDLILTSALVRIALPWNKMLRPLSSSEPSPREAQASSSSPELLPNSP